MDTALLRRSITVICILVCITGVWGAGKKFDPYIGYVYPAGGSRGETFLVTVRGQFLRQPDRVYVSGEGVKATIIEYEGPAGPLNKLQQDELRKRIQEIASQRTGRKFGKKEDKPTANPTEKQADKTGKNGKAKSAALPDLPELRNLEKLTGEQLKRLVDKFINPAKRPKAPIAEKVTIEVTIDPNAEPGDRELRLMTPVGLSNPRVFQVRSMPEICEPEKDNTDAKQLPAPQPPVVLNGRIMPGEVDRFPINLNGGQKLVVDVQARKLIPYLADAVPGWFQAVVCLYDPNGREVAFDDDHGYDPDPAFTYRVPGDGEYILEIRDSIYRGREDFVYRIDVADESQLPTAITKPEPDESLESAREHFGFIFDPTDETEPNDKGQASMSVQPPRIIRGVIESPSDKDVIHFEGRAGDIIVAEVFARRMGSPLDSLVKLIDTSGRVVAWNDDQKDMESALLTHHADSYLSAKLPANGRYFVQVSDSQNQGGPAYEYYLRVSAPQPGFALRMTPSALNISGGRAAPITVYALRKDGWDGDIRIALKDAPRGFDIQGAVIPKGRNQVRMTLAAPREKLNKPVVLQLEGSALINGKTTTAPVVPADDMMQAFAYRHLVPTESLIVAVPRTGLMSPRLDMDEDTRLAIPAGGTAEVLFSAQNLTPNSPIKVELSDPPAGISLVDTRVSRRGISLVLKADDKLKGYVDNLIVEVTTEMDLGKITGGPGNKQQVSAGVLPAIPIEIVER